MEFKQRKQITVLALVVLALSAITTLSAITIGNAEGMVLWLAKESHLYKEEKGKPSRRMRRLLKKGY